MRVPDRCPIAKEKMTEGKWIEYLDGRATPAERRAIEEHLAGCAPCRVRAEEFRAVWNALDDLPAISVSPSFDASLRARLAAEPRRRPFWHWLPSPRLAFAMMALVALAAWISAMPQFARNQLAGNLSATNRAAFNQSAANRAATNQPTVDLLSTKGAAANQSVAVITPASDADARMSRDLPVLENYDVVSQFDALSELPVSPAVAGSSDTKKENR